MSGIPNAGIRAHQGLSERLFSKSSMKSTSHDPAAPCYNLRSRSFWAVVIDTGLGQIQRVDSCLTMQTQLEAQ